MTENEQREFLKRRVEIFTLSEREIEAELSSLPAGKEAYIKSGALASVRIQREKAEEKLNAVAA